MNWCSVQSSLGCRTVLQRSQAALACQNLHRHIGKCRSNTDMDRIDRNPFIEIPENESEIWLAFI